MVDDAHKKRKHEAGWQHTLPLLRVLLKKIAHFFQDHFWKDFRRLQWPQSDGEHSNLTPEHVQAFVKRMLPMQTQRGVGEVAVFTRAVLELDDEDPDADDSDDEDNKAVNDKRYQTICCSPCETYHGVHRLVTCAITPLYLTNQCRMIRVWLPYDYRILPYAAVCCRMLPYGEESLWWTAGYGLLLLSTSLPRERGRRGHAFRQG